MPSRFQELFGEGYRGRPRNDEMPVGTPTGDPRITELARRRATRVLKAENPERFEELMRQEAEWLQSNGAHEALPVGEG